MINTKKIKNQIARYCNGDLKLYFNLVKLVNMSIKQNPNFKLTEIAEKLKLNDFKK